MNPITHYSPNGRVVCSIPEECTYDNVNCGNTPCSISSINGSCSITGCNEQPTATCCNIGPANTSYFACRRNSMSGPCTGGCDGSISYPTSPLDGRTTYGCSYVQHQLPINSPLSQLMGRLNGIQDTANGYGGIPTASSGPACPTMMAPVYSSAGGNSSYCNSWSMGGCQ